MKFSDLVRAQAHLQQQALQKEAGIIGRGIGAAVGLPFRVAGRATGLAVRGAGRAAAAPIKAGARSTMKRHGKLMGGLMLGGAALGTAGVAGSAVGKAREYNRGFDPRIQDASMRRIR